LEPADEIKKKTVGLPARELLESWENLKKPRWWGEKTNCKKKKKRKIKRTAGKKSPGLKKRRLEGDPRKRLRETAGTGGGGGGGS